MALRCTPYFFTACPQGYHTETSVQLLFKDLLEVLLPMRLNGSLLISNEGKFMLGKTYEIPLQIIPVLIPLREFKEIRIELCLELVALEESIMPQFLYGESWIISSISHEFLNLCERTRDKNSVLICSAEVDVDLMKSSQVPSFYALFPALDCPTTFLMRKIACKELARNIDLPPIFVDQAPAEITNFVFENFPIERYSPSTLISGLHTYLASLYAGNNAKENFYANEESLENNEKKNKVAALDNLANSICRKKGKK